jgi:hypothetical protein
MQHQKIIVAGLADVAIFELDVAEESVDSCNDVSFSNSAAKNSCSSFAEPSMEGTRGRIEGLLKSSPVRLRTAQPPPHSRKHQLTSAPRSAPSPDTRAASVSAISSIGLLAEKGRNQVVDIGRVGSSTRGESA